MITCQGPTSRPTAGSKSRGNPNPGAPHPQWVGGVPGAWLPRSPPPHVPAGLLIRIPRGSSIRPLVAEETTSLPLWPFKGVSHPLVGPTRPGVLRLRDRPAGAGAPDRREWGRHRHGETPTGGETVGGRDRDREEHSQGETQAAERMEMEKRDTRDMKTHPAPITVRETKRRRQRGRDWRRETAQRWGEVEGDPQRIKTRANKGERVGRARTCENKYL